jgi:phosphohistidine phosphatase
MLWLAMRLYLIRHGTAEEARGGDDSLRALTDEGRREVEEVSGAIPRSSDLPVEIWSSPYLRAKQTAEILRRRLKLPGEIRLTDAMLPESGWSALRDALEEGGLMGTRTVLAVGHNPSISAMVGDACGGARIAMAKAAVACIDFDGRSGMGRGELRWLVTPKSLRGARSR